MADGWTQSQVAVWVAGDTSGDGGGANYSSASDEGCLILLE